LKYRLSLVGLLVAASLISLVLVRVHILLNGANAYPSLVLNLGLAWIPFISALAAFAAMRSRVTFFLIMPVCTLVWLVFFPNAPYLLTDFQHLATANSTSPLWFDVILLIWFAWTGLLLGIASLYWMQEIVTRTFNSVAGWVFAIGATSLSSIGVYMGRFLRWNSWDLLQEALPIAKDMYSFVRHPVANLPVYTFLILFTLLFLFIYVTIHLLGWIIADRRQSTRS
jgi:uncharacterized membrane protein